MNKIALRPNINNEERRRNPKHPALATRVTAPGKKRPKVARLQTEPSSGKKATPTERTYNQDTPTASDEEKTETQLLRRARESTRPRNHAERNAWECHKDQTQWVKLRGHTYAQFCDRTGRCRAQVRRTSLLGRVRVMMARATACVRTCD